MCVCLFCVYWCVALARAFGRRDYEDIAVAAVVVFVWISLSAIAFFSHCFVFLLFVMCYFSIEKITKFLVNANKFLVFKLFDQSPSLRRISPLRTRFSAHTIYTISGGCHKTRKLLFVVDSVVIVIVDIFAAVAAPTLHLWVWVRFSAFNEKYKLCQNSDLKQQTATGREWDGERDQHFSKIMAKRIGIWIGLWYCGLCAYLLYVWESVDSSFENILE